MNDAIDPALCSLRYITVDQVARKAISLGKGGLIVKIDIKAAYHLIPVSPNVVEQCSIHRCHAPLQIKVSPEVI